MTLLSLFKILCIIGLIIAMMFSGCITNVNQRHNHVVIVDTNQSFDSIQEAIDHAEENQTIMVYNGVYTETIIVDKPVSIQGENKDTTIIEGKGSGTVISVVANHITMSGFTIRQAGSNSVKITDTVAGILIRSEYNQIRDINLSYNINYGIALLHAHWNHVEQCTFYHNDEAGIYAEYAHNNTFTNNIFKNNSRGLYLKFNHHGSILSNTIRIHDAQGIYFYACRYHTISDTIFSDNERGMHIKGSKYNTIKNNMFISNNIGIYLCCSGIDNVIYQNIFLKNTEAHVKGYPINQFDNGSAGNYWDDYTGLDNDGDGIGDIIYNVTTGKYGEKNIDYYPLISLPSQ